MNFWWRPLMRYARPYVGQLLGIMLLMLLGTVLEALVPWPLKLIVDYILEGRGLPRGISWLAIWADGRSSAALIAWLAAAAVFLFVATQFVKIGQAYMQAAVGGRMSHALGAHLFEQLQHQSLNFHSRQRTGDLVRRVTADSKCVRQLWLGFVFPGLTACVTLTVLFFIMWQLDSTLALLAILVALPVGMLVRVFFPSMAARTYDKYRLEGDIMALAEQTLTALPIVQGFGQEARGEGAFRELCRRAEEAYRQASVSEQKLHFGLGTAAAAGTAAILGMGALHVLDGVLSVGGLLVFLAYLGYLYAPLETLASLSSGLAAAAAGARRTMEVLKTNERVAELPHARPVPVDPAKKGIEVRLENVTFGHRSGRAVLKNINLAAAPGETIALVGRTGVGKSTLVSLVPRFFDPWEGCVTFNGEDVRNLQLASLRAQVALVLQESFLLPISVAENIAYGRPDAEREAIEAAAKAAHADDFIEQLPEGYDTVLGERGCTLSGGQRQRIAIARAFLKDAPIVILDEPASALDAESERLLLEALERLRDGRTLFVIAHRFSTIRTADRIVLLKEGEIIASGAHDELYAGSSDYRAFFKAQFGAGAA